MFAIWIGVGVLIGIVLTVAALWTLTYICDLMNA